MDEVKKNIRVSAAIQDFNLGLDNIIEFLDSKGIQIQKNLNAKLSEEAYALLYNEFSAEKELKETAREVYYSKLPESTRLMLEREKVLNTYIKIPRLDNKISEAIKDYKSSKYVEALTLIEEILTHGYRLHIVYNLKGIILKKTGRLEEALSMYDKAIASNEIFTPAIHNKAVLLKTQKKYSEAIFEYSKAIKFAIKLHEFDDLPLMFSSRSNCYKELGDFQKSESDKQSSNQYNLNKDSILVNLKQPRRSIKEDYEVLKADISDGYGGTVDQKFIDEALDGNADAIWNID